MTDYVHNPRYQELTRYGQCVIDTLAGNMLLEGKKISEYPRREDHLQAFLNLRNVLLTVGGIHSINQTLENTTHPHHGILASCQNQMRFISR